MRLTSHIDIKEELSLSFILRCVQAGYDFIIKPTTDHTKGVFKLIKIPENIEFEKLKTDLSLMKISQAKLSINNTDYVLSKPTWSSSWVLTETV